MQTEAQVRADRKYKSECKRVGVTFAKNDPIVPDALSAYLKDAGISASSYVKELIIKDLKEKGYLNQNY